MKIPYRWLQEFIDLPDDAAQVGERLTLAGLECAGVTNALAGLDDLVVGEVLQVDAHPDADNLTVCRVNTGAGEPHQIVCGAPNVHAGMKAPVILPGGRLPDGTKIRKAELRGVASDGMLCSARELGLGDDHSGILALDSTLPPGAPLVRVLGDDEPVIEIEVTPNRGDALSILGVARDLSALYDRDLRLPDPEPVPAALEDVFPIELEAPEGCPVFAGRVIRDIDPNARSPLWLRERLRRAGVRPLHPVVDVTQYVMLELGQPMHAYDLSRLQGGIKARWARRGERVALLDGSEPDLAPDMLVIADDKRALGLAGLMGGSGSSVRDTTRDIFLESAFFDPAAIQGRARRLGLLTDAAHRFERGVDFSGQERAIERATALILEIAGGKPGPTQVARSESHLPSWGQLRLRRSKLDALLGVAVPDAKVADILHRLGLKPVDRDGGWEASPPPHRFDLAIEEDLVEEVGRIFGYQHIPSLQYPAARPMNPVTESRLPVSRLKQVLVQRGYQEVITYSFVDQELQRRITGDAGIALANPISSDMTHMRASLWPGLIQVLRHNLNRQQERVRIFESGLRFIAQETEIKQENLIAGLSAGALMPEQWGLEHTPAGLFDVKSDVEALAALGGGPALRAEAAPHPALHPGRCARLTLAGEQTGWLGAIHPELANSLEIPPETLLFELAVTPLIVAQVPELQAISRFPSVRRDLALVLPEAVSAAQVESEVRQAAGAALRELVIFDLYRGRGLETGTKSLAIGLIFQDKSRTLTDQEVDDRVAGVVDHLKNETGAKLRE